ncbi:hypothetical protein OSTOST_06998 [Ostertagia ostertagi]
MTISYWTSYLVVQQVPEALRSLLEQMLLEMLLVVLKRTEKEEKPKLIAGRGVAIVSKADSRRRNLSVPNPTFITRTNN